MASFLPGDGEGMLSGPGKPTRTWPGPLCAQFNRLGWLETTALASSASRSPGVSVTPQRKSEPWMLSGAHKTVTRGGQGLPVRDCSTLSHSSRDFLGVSCWDFPILWPFCPCGLLPAGTQGLFDSPNFGFFLRPVPVLSAGS